MKPLRSLSHRAHVILILCAASLLLAAAVTAGGAAYLLSYALRPADDGHDVAATWAGMHRDYDGLQAWHDSLLRHHALRDTFLLAPDGTRLHALYVRAPRPTRRTAVLVHGYTDNAVSMMALGRMYTERLGYHILLPDLRYAGLSGGDHIQMGWLDRLDVARWVREGVPALFGDSATVVLHGVSMGAATVMMLSGDPQPPRVRAAVEDCGYTSVAEQFAKELRERFHLPPFPLIPAASALCRLRYGWSFTEADALRQVSRSHVPTLFIHGSADTYVPTAMGLRLHAAHPGLKALWIAPGSAHARSYRDHPEEYTRRVRAFVDPLM